MSGKGVFRKAHSGLARDCCSYHFWWCLWENNPDCRRSMADLRFWRFHWTLNVCTGYYSLFCEFSSVVSADLWPNQGKSERPPLSMGSTSGQLPLFWFSRRKYHSLKVSWSDGGCVSPVWYQHGTRLEPTWNQIWCPVGIWAKVKPSGGKVAKGYVHTAGLGARFWFFAEILFFAWLFTL